MRVGVWQVANVNPPQPFTLQTRHSSSQKQYFGAKAKPVWLHGIRVLTTKAQTLLSPKQLDCKQTGMDDLSVGSCAGVLWWVGHRAHWALNITTEINYSLHRQLLEDCQPIRNSCMRNYATGNRKPPTFYHHLWGSSVTKSHFQFLSLLESFQIRISKEWALPTCLQRHLRA